MSLPNPEKYRIHAQGLGYSEAQIDKVIHDIFRLLQPFVDAAFGVHPVQLAERQRVLLSSGTQSEHARLELEFQAQQNTWPAGPTGGGDGSP